MSKPGRPGSGEPTLRDIAKATGCSLMTVSRVLGAHADLVAEPKRSHIRRVAEQLGYRPNLNIRALRRGSGTLVGLLTERFDARSHAILIGLHDTLVPQGLLPCLLVIDHQPAQPGMSAGDSAVRHLIERRMAAILGILPDPAVAPEWLPSLTREAMERGIPCLAIGATAHEYGLPMVRADLAGAAHHLVDHAVGQGAKAACLVEDPDGDGWQRALAAAVRSEAKRRGVALRASARPLPKAGEAVLALSEAGVAGLAGQALRPAWISTHDPAFTSLAGTAVDLRWEDLGRAAGEHLLRQREGAGQDRTVDLEPLVRRQE